MRNDMIKKQLKLIFKQKKSYENTCLLERKFNDQPKTQICMDIYVYCYTYEITLNAMKFTFRTTQLIFETS